jgi:hypothetical protein
MLRWWWFRFSRPASHRIPRLITVWSQTSPYFLLMVAVVCFFMGLNFFVFASNQVSQRYSWPTIDDNIGTPEFSDLPDHHRPDIPHVTRFGLHRGLVLFRAVDIYPARRQQILLGSHYWPLWVPLKPVWQANLPFWGKTEAAQKTAYHGRLISSNFGSCYAICTNFHFSYSGTGRTACYARRWECDTLFTVLSLWDASCDC